MRLDKDTEKKTFDSLRKGSTQALATTFNRNYSILFNFGFSICHDEELTKDAIQELFIYIWEKRSNLSEVNSVRAYLLTSQRRLIIKALKKRKNESKQNLLYKSELPDKAFSAQDMLILKETDEQNKHVLKIAIEEIPERMREALYLKTYNNLSYKEISEIMDISYQVSRNYVSEALHRLRKLLS